MSEISPQNSAKEGVHNEINDLLNGTLKQYEDETNEMELALKQLGLVDEMGNLCKVIDEPLEKLKNVQMSFKTGDISTNAICLSYADNLRKDNAYLDFMNVYATTLSKLIEKAVNDNIQLKRDLEGCSSTINNIMSSTSTNKGTKLLQERAERYREELAKFEKKYPSLKDSQLNLDQIEREVQKLDALRRQKDELEKELEKYHGLKPDLIEAHQQIEDIKQESERINKKLLQKE